MSQQNINQYVYKKIKLNPSWNNLDMSLASDEIDFNQEVVFSNSIIGINDGNRLPIHFDLNNSDSCQQITLDYGDFNSGNTLVSLSYYNPNNENLSCFTGDSLCDIGLVGTDNGLVPEMSGETIYFSMGLYTGSTKWDRYHFDRRTKLYTITAYTNSETSLMRGLYVNDFNTIIGDSVEENTLFNFIQSKGLNTIYCYDLNGILSESSGITAVREFNTNVRTYGVDIIGGIGGSSNTIVGGGSNTRLSYNTGCTEDSQKYDYFNLENEFWNYPNAGTVTFDTWEGYVNTINQSLSSTTTLFDTYIGQIDDPTLTNTPTQISDFLVGNLERIFLACYITTNQFTGSTNYGLDIIDDELILIGDSAILQNKVAKVAIIYHGGSSFMNSYFESNSFDSAYNNFLNSYNSWSNPAKSGIELIGYIIYGYQQVKNL